MTGPSRWQTLRRLVASELDQLTTVQPSDRLWQMPVAAALASGLPLLIGAAFDHLAWGLVSSLGGLVFLYVPATPLHHRMVTVMACAFGMIACYALGVLSHFFAPLIVPALTFTGIVVTMVCRYYGIGPPGSLFFVMAASIGAYSPVEPLQVPLVVGLLAMGSVLACLITFLYSLYALRLRPAEPVPALPVPTFDRVVFDAVVAGACVGLSLVAAQLLQLQRPYWVPVSCLAVIQGASLRAVWNRQLQRVLGTAAGLLAAWALLLLPLDRWSIAATMMALTFAIETLVVRHYGVAMLFVTPLTLLLAEAAHLGRDAPGALIQARFVDTALGCVIGLLGGVCLHSPRFRATVGGRLRRLIPSRLRP